MRVSGVSLWDVLKPLRDDVEACYCNWYLTTLSMKWGSFVESGLLDEWRLNRTPNQYTFFTRHVQPWLAKGETRRAFVVISDTMEVINYRIGNQPHW